MTVRRFVYLAVAIASVVLIVTIALGMWQDPTIGIVSVLATLAGLLLDALHSLYSSARYTKRIIPFQAVTESYTDRTAELETVLNNLEDGGIFAVYGPLGVGLTQFLRNLSNEINRQTRWKAIYASLGASCSSTIAEAVGSQFAFEQPATCQSACKVFRRAKFPGKRKNHTSKLVFLIDDLHQDEIEMIHDFITGIRRNEPDAIFVFGFNQEHEPVGMPARTTAISLKPFGMTDSEGLIANLGVALDEDAKHAVIENAEGLPSYLVFLARCDESPEGDANLEAYLVELLKGLDDDTKQLIIKMSCYYEATGHTILPESFEASDLSLRRLVDLSLLTRTSRTSYQVNEAIARKIVASNKQISNEMFGHLYREFSASRPSEAPLYFLLSEEPIESTEKFVEDLRQFSESDNPSGLAPIAEEIRTLSCVNTNVKSNRAAYCALLTAYINMQMEFGNYDKARSFLASQKQFIADWRINLVDQGPIDFEFAYALADLAHLTNGFSDARLTLNAIEQRLDLDESQAVRCRFLKAHCLRHIGTDMPAALAEFTQLLKEIPSDYSNVKIAIRTRSSICAIRTFLGDKDFDYEKMFREIDEIAHLNGNHAIVNYAQRHRAIYEMVINNNRMKAKRILENTLVELENTGQRIRYDFYFELAECYRLMASPGKEDSYSSMASAQYEKALAFAQRVHDINLETSSKMGQMLTQMQHKRLPDIEREPLESELLAIKAHCKKAELRINESEALFLLTVLRRESFTSDQIRFWKKLGFHSLQQAAEHYNLTGRFELKLTVM